MAKTAILAIRIISDATKAAKGFQQTESAADRMGRRTQRASNIAKVGLLALAAGAFSSAKAAAADERGQAVLAQALKNSTGARKADVRSVESWIDKTQRATGIADDQLRPALTNLVGATHDVAKAQELAGLAMDISTRYGKPLTSVSEALAKGYAGNTTALGRLVPGIDKALLKSGDFNAIQKELAKTVGGSAAAAAKTNEGKTARMAIAYGELQETVGGFLLPILSALVVLLTGAANFVERNATAVAILAGGLGTVAAAVIGLNTAYKSYKAIMEAARVAQLAFNLVMAANPVVLVVLAIVALAAAFVIAYKKSATFRGIVQAVGTAGKAAIGWVVDKAKALWSQLGKLGPAASRAKAIGVGAFRAYTAPIRTVISLVKSVVGWIKRIHFPSPPGWMKKAGGFFGLGGDTPRPPSAGGRRRVAAGGRGGPGDSYLSVPVGGSSSGGNVYITVSGALDPVAVAKQIYDLLRQYGIRIGRPVVVS